MAGGFAAVARGLRQRAHDHEVDPLESFRPTKAQLSILTSTHRRPMLRGPNQIGKTICAAVDLLDRMLGRNRWKKTRPPPIRCWFVCSSWKQSKTIMEKVWSLCPKDQVAASVHYTAKNGFTGEWLELVNGSTCRFVTAHQDTTDLASATLDFIGVDEPPFEHIWGELVARVRHTRGTIALYMTPINRPVDWLRERVARGEIEDHHFGLNLEAVTPVGSRFPFQTKEQLEEFERELLPAERAQRVHGDWEGVAGERVFAAWSEELVKTTSLAGRVAHGIGIDHGAKAGRQHAVLIGVRFPDSHNPRIRVWAIDEAKSDERTGMLDDARLLLDMLERNGLTLANIDQWVGDRRGRGDFKGNVKSNADLLRSIAEVSGIHRYALPDPLQGIETPTKWHTSVWYGCRLINKLMADDLLTVDPKCSELIDGIRYWEGGEHDEKKDPVDAFRYIVERMVKAHHLYPSAKAKADRRKPL